MKYGAYLLRNAFLLDQNEAKKNSILMKTRINILNRIFTFLNFPDLKLQVKN